MNKTIRLLVMVALCAVFAQSAFAAVYENSPMGNIKVMLSKKFYVATKVNATERTLGTGANVIARAAEERRRAYEGEHFKETLYQRLVAESAAKKKLYKGFRPYVSGVGAPVPFAKGVAPKKPAVATAAGDMTNYTAIPPQNAAV